MIPVSWFNRLMSTYQEETMPCSKPCSKCTCAPCGHLDYTDEFPFEADKSALGTQQDKWLTSPSTFLDRLCALEPGAIECKSYEV